MKPYIKNVFVFVVILLFAGATGVMGETLRDSVKSVLQNNPDVTSVAYNRLARDQEVRQAMADFSPGSRPCYRMATLINIILIFWMMNFIRDQRPSDSTRIYSGEALPSRKRNVKNSE